MKEERKRQKHLESNFEEEYFEDHGGGGIQPLCVYVCIKGHLQLLYLYTGRFLSVLVFSGGTSDAEIILI